ncbi:SCO2525 family SAM-dependent methyltransferase [Actinoplanes sp. M2I2]|uniref:SCO2525 family SAM-dependent methyltransferase n=1 Tax=Actinoplanes sp. M2I2 TaxID=1734444 RepID=UPI0020214E8D|nr:SCO2525 family SAM-dependent methyltransferase [Actinoplanes sp. M2I2]
MELFEGWPRFRRYDQATQHGTVAQIADPPAVTMALNWDAFQPELYWRQNYAFFRADDRRFLELLREFFGAESPRTDMKRLGIDVGAGANLYPTLAMLPLCDEITLMEYGAKNCEWLHNEVQGYSSHWNQFWRLLREKPEYAKFGANVRRRLARTAKVRQGSLFTLPEQEERYHVGTMFFVAESITDNAEQFYGALDAFLASLAPGAPFAAAFMRNSDGYVVGDQKFPAFQIDESDISDYLSGAARDHRCVAVDQRGQFINGDNVPDKANTWTLRAGYDGMILALGHAK